MLLKFGLLHYLLIAISLFNVITISLFNVIGISILNVIALETSQNYFLTLQMATVEKNLMSIWNLLIMQVIAEIELILRNRSLCGRRQVLKRWNSLGFA